MECQSLFANDISALFHDIVVLAGGETKSVLIPASCSVPFCGMCGTS